MLLPLQYLICFQCVSGVTLFILIIFLPEILSNTLHLRPCLLFVLLFLRSLLDRKPGARTLILPSTVWADQPPKIHSCGKVLYSKHKFINLNVYQ